MNQRYADKAIEKTLQSDKRWGSRDRAFVAENTYEIVRWWRLIGELAEIQNTDINSLWKIFGTWWLYSGHSLPDWEEFKGLDPAVLQERFDRLKSVRKIHESIPDWMDDLGMHELADRWDKEIQALNIPAEVVLRANTLKVSRGQLIGALEKEHVETVKVEGYADALKLQRRQNVFSTSAFRLGYFEVQDASSQLVGPALNVEPGMRVVDACAGAGGKTLHLASLMKNKGRIIAMDTEAWKLDNLKKRAARAGISIIEPRLIDSSKVIKRLYDSADRLLLDVPCSGLGVLRRNPDAKWKLNESFIANIRKTQAEILEEYSPILKNGGTLVYSTCSILPSENRQQVDKFLQSGKFELLNDKNVFPSESGFDGFYIAVMKKLS